MKLLNLLEAVLTINKRAYIIIWKIKLSLFFIVFFNEVMNEDRAAGIIINIDKNKNRVSETIVYNEKNGALLSTKNVDKKIYELENSINEVRSRVTKMEISEENYIRNILDAIIESQEIISLKQKEIDNRLGKLEAAEYELRVLKDAIIYEKS